MSLPDEIFVEDFKKLNGKKPETIAFNEVDSYITGKKMDLLLLKKVYFLMSMLGQIISEDGRQLIRCLMSSLLWALFQQIIF